MHCAFVLIDRLTNEPDGVVSTYLDHLDDFDYDRTTHELLTIPTDHPVFHEQLCWTAPRREVFGALWDRQLIRRSPAQIDAEAAERAATRRATGKSVSEILLDLINEERQASGKVALTMDDINVLRGIQ